MAKPKTPTVRKTVASKPVEPVFRTVQEYLKALSLTNAKLFKTRINVNDVNGKTARSIITLLVKTIPSSIRRVNSDFFTTYRRYFDLSNNAVHAMNSALKLKGQESPSSSEQEVTEQGLTYKPRNRSQRIYLKALQNPKRDIVCAVGSAGTGKTLFATIYGFQQLQEGNFDKLVITRPNIAVDNKDIGFLPGSMQSKMTPWLLPILEVLYELSSKSHVDSLMREEQLEIVPLAFIRGRTFKRSFVIMDEAQNTSTHAMLSVLTRFGEGSKMVITGDPMQTDRHKVNGLKDFVDRCETSKLSRIKVVKFSADDVERHPVVKEILKLYEPKQQLVETKVSEVLQNGTTV